MAGAFRCKLNLSSIFIHCVVLLGKLVRLTGKAWNFVSVYHCHIGAALSVVLVILNFYTYQQGCRNWAAPPLPHGFAPLFPSHYFPNSSASERQGLPDMSQAPPNLDQLDAYLNSNIVQNSLDSGVPPVVHVVWCDIGPFTYRHYVSVLSAFKLLKPSVLVLHTVDTPHKDPDGYFQFLEDLQRDLPPLLVKPLWNKNACYGSGHHKLEALVSLIGSRGGIALSSRVVLVPSAIVASDLLTSKISIGQSAATKEPLVVFLQTDAFKSSSRISSLVSVAKLIECSDSEHFVFSPQNMCVALTENIFPHMTFEGSRRIDYMLRWVGYGTVSELVPKPASEVIVPNIVHYVWLGKRQLKYFGYLSVMSALHVLKADTVYVHGDYEPGGELWRQAKLDPRLKFIVRKFPSAVYSQPIVKFASHASDYLRADLLLRYGGVYADWDVIFLRELSPLTQKYNTTANVDWPATGAFPDVFNLGVLVSAPGAPFLRHFLESYRWYLDAHWSYNAIHMPYKVYEKQPQSLNVDRHLQILCARQKCHATWLKGYKSQAADHLKPGIIDWTKDALAIHWTYPDPPDFENEDSLVKGTSEAARIGQNVLRKAGKLTSG